MFEDMKKNVHDWEDDEEIKTYLTALLNKQAFDRSGLIYGMGHEVYSISDPRAKTFRKFVKKLSDAIFTKVSVPISISTADLCTVCWDFRSSCIPRFLPLEESPAGVHIDWKNL